MQPLLEHLAPLAFLALAACAGAPPAPTTPPDPAPAAPVVDRCDDLATCEASCTRGRVESCEEAGRQMAAHPIESSAARLAAVLARACDGNRGDACKHLADLLSYSPALPRDDARAKALYERGCDLGEGISCLGAASGLALPGEPSADAKAYLDKARALLEKRCEAHDGTSCGGLSAVYLLSGDNAKSQALVIRSGDELSKGCLGGAGDDCVKAAMQLADPSRNIEPERVKQLLERGCNLNVAEACMYLANASSSVATKIALLKRACSGERDYACLLLGRLQSEGTMMEQASARLTLDHGIQLARARCDLGETQACDALAGSIGFGLLTPAEARPMIVALEAVCDRHVATTCNQLAEALAGGPEALRDADKAARLKKKACDYGYPFACPDPVAAINRYRR